MIPADFRHWLADQQERRDAVGSLSRAIQRDQTLWQLPATGKAPVALLRAFQRAWDGWVSSGGQDSRGGVLKALDAPMKATSTLTLSLGSRIARWGASLPAERRPLQEG